MKKLARGGTTTELDKNVKKLEASGWKRITENKLDDSGASYGDISWVCVMEMKGDDRKQKWQFPY